MGVLKAGGQVYLRNELDYARKQTERLSNKGQSQWLFTTGKGLQGTAPFVKGVNHALIYRG